MISELGIATFEARWNRSALGVVQLLVPMPIAHDPRWVELGVTRFAVPDARWHRDLEALVGRLVCAVEARSSTAIEIRARPTPTRAPWVDRLIRFATFQPTLDPFDANPLGLSPVQALLAAIRNEAVPVASLRAGSIEIVVTESLPVLWVWRGESVPPGDDLVATVAGGLPTTALESSAAVRVPYVVASVIVDFHARQVLWTDGAGVLGFRANCLLPHPGNVGMPDPRQAFVPPAGEWGTNAPRWATDARPKVVADLIAQGWNVEETPGAFVEERQTPRA